MFVCFRTRTHVSATYLEVDSVGSGKNDNFSYKSFEFDYEHTNTNFLF